MISEAPAPIDVPCHQNVNKFIAKRKKLIGGLHLNAQCVCVCVGGAVSKEIGIQDFTLQPLYYATGLLPVWCSRGWVEGRRGEKKLTMAQIWTSMHRLYRHCRVQLIAKAARTEASSWRVGLQTTPAGWCAVRLFSAFSIGTVGLEGLCILLFTVHIYFTFTNLV